MSHRDWDLQCKVYIGNLGNNASKHEIESSFNKYGPLKNIWIARNPPGFAFVEFDDPRDAEDAVRGLDGTRLCGNRIRVEMSSGRSRQQRGGRNGSGGRDRRYGGSENHGRYKSRSRSPKRRSVRSRSDSPPPRYNRTTSRDSRDRR